MASPGTPYAASHRVRLCSEFKHHQNQPLPVLAPPELPPTGCACAVSSRNFHGAQNDLPVHSVQELLQAPHPSPHTPPCCTFLPVLPTCGDACTEHHPLAFTVMNLTQRISV
ncbi:uncharacterized protein [Periplaneta americana]|uniref:uncharacterized protein n=1 Tax=Periplaneta americana TaxID=6978 RepID=UPI0037E7B0E9